MSKKEENAFQNLCKRDDIIITKTDKGSTIIIADVDDYVQWTIRQQRILQKISNRNNRD